MVKAGVLIFVFLVTGASYSQENYIQPGLIRASATISPSIMLSKKQSNYYISGFAEYFLDKKISFRGEAYYFIDSDIPAGYALQNTSELTGAIKTYFGAFYHLNKENFDFNFGFQPGLSILTINDYSSNFSASTTAVSPSFSIETGVAYYVWKYFHFFADLAYVRSSINAYSNAVRNADELIFSAGLGFQIQSKKEVK